MTDLNSAPLTRARGLLTAVLRDGGHLDPMARLEVAQALNELVPAMALPTYPAVPVTIEDSTDALSQARREMRAALTQANDLDDIHQVSLAICCVDVALAMVSP